MSSNKPRIQSYIESRLYEQFEQERSNWGLSQSQALEQILLERYQSDITKENEDDRDLMPLITSINELRLRVSNLEDELEGKLLAKLQDKFPIELEPAPRELVTSELHSELPGELELVTSELHSELPGELELVTSELHSELPGELELVTSELHSELPGELELVTSELHSELPGELELVTSELHSELPGELELVTSELHSELEFFKGLSQRALSKRLGCSHAYIGKKEQEDSFVSLSASLDPQGISWELKGKKYYPSVRGINSATNADEDLSPLVIYAFDTEAKQYYYWEGLGKSKRGFNDNLHHACKYKFDTTAKRRLEEIYESTEAKKQAFIFEAGRFKLGFDKESFLRANRHTGVVRDRNDY